MAEKENLPKLKAYLKFEDKYYYLDLEHFDDDEGEVAMDILEDGAWREATFDEISLFDLLKWGVEVDKAEIESKIADYKEYEAEEKMSEKLLHENYTPEELAELDEMAQEFVKGLKDGQ